MAVAGDQFGNVACQALLNVTLIKKGGIKFGNPDETVSGVLGKNKEWETLTGIGKFIAGVLNKIEKNHVEKAIEEDEI